MRELVEFLRARLDADERAARAASGPRGRFTRWDLSDWHGQLEEPHSLISQGTTNHPGALGHFTATPVPTVQAEHIVRHDPARVLAEVDAKRRILDEHFGFLHPQGNPDRACRQCSDRRGDDDPLSHGSNDDLWVRLVPAPCLTVRLLALPYAGHKDYREEWRP